MSYCDRMNRIVGDRGQQYEVRAQTEAECGEFVVGWTDEPDGGDLVKTVNEHPSWHTPIVIDRRPK